MGREPLSLRIAPLTPHPCGYVVLCGISTCFQVLSPSGRQVVHALLTRSPLSDHPKTITPFDLHVLGTPPAFVLSQDQTLEFNLLQRFRCLVLFNFAWSFRSRVVVSQLLRINLACLLFRYIVFKVLAAPFPPALARVSRDSFDSIPRTFRFVNPFFQKNFQEFFTRFGHIIFIENTGFLCYDESTWEVVCQKDRHKK